MGGRVDARQVVSAYEAVRIMQCLLRHVVDDRAWERCNMLHRAHALSSTTEAFNEGCAKLRSIFSRLDDPIGLVNSTINMFILSKPEKKIDDGNTIRIVLPFKDQIAANANFLFT